MELTIVSGGTAVPPLQPRVCRNGHELKVCGVDYWVVKAGRRKGQQRCLHCHRSHRPHRERPCKICGQPFSGSRSRYCEECRRGETLAARDGVAVARRNAGRVCVRCNVKKPLADFLIGGVQTVQGTKQYRDVCDGCVTVDDDVDVPADSPYEIARREVERRFGVPSREWINDREHPLNVLHLCRMVSINNGGKGKVKVHLDHNVFDARRAYLAAVAAGFRPVSPREHGNLVA